ncbi:uncharacterized protein Z520_00530 [Fonsecaea multimorphosa CBS 102226]|uniref:Isochorismatase-like domain-containing protein n=1 Tax=Fonsecaea multimorphosa CBS 102226 TaxID=1442371 RepID=A0A0D2L440_9EURO|nr:uncharacterized protein Z520_00530 [Fonsecaea multimorphosa CBS 102226]KIY03839.1 hypothetical protein Z520_00530 [Fonsecaea multimorphosa CBS 102226]OAL32528.1 hypothetical protein AYO22_00550 [Fonsecaea multimorphosa]
MAPKTALLVIDMQAFFSPMTTTALPNIIKLCEQFSKTSAPIVFTKHGHPKAEMVANSTSQLVRKWGVSGSIGEGAPEGEMLPELHKFLPKNFRTKHVTLGESLPEPTSPEFPKLVPKNTYDGFIHTPLSTILEHAKIERVVVVGVMTDCCCDTTARAAFNRGYETWLLSDACGSANGRQHKAGLQGFEFAFGEVMTTHEAMEGLAAMT